MEKPLLLFIPKVLCLLLKCVVSASQDVVFQSSFLTTHGPSVTTLLHGNTSDITLNLQTISRSNLMGSFDSPSCVPGVTQWTLISEQVAKTTIQVKLTLKRSLRLCGYNETNTDCCTNPLCVWETLQVSACKKNISQASLIIQVNIYTRLVSGNVLFDNKTLIQNQIYRPLGQCPCDLTVSTCDLWCCCDEDCSDEYLLLFKSRCLPGPFGGQFPEPEYQCSVQSSQNFPDWFPFLCVTSPPENNPYLGPFFLGNTKASKPGVSFGSSMLSAPELSSMYFEGSPILTLQNKYLTIPQTLNGHCVIDAPVAFLKNFDVSCETPLQACPTGFPLLTKLEDLRAVVRDGFGGNVEVVVINQWATKLSDFITNIETLGSSALVCENVTLALDYNLFWRENGITEITLTRTVGNVTLNGRVSLMTRYSAKFLCGNNLSKPTSGNPGYQVGRPVIGGVLNTSTENDSVSVEGSLLNLWKPVNSGFCSPTDVRPVVFGENSTSGCFLPVTQNNFTQCSLLRDSVTSLQNALVKATLVARNARPDPLTVADWLNISYMTLNSSQVEDSNSSCTDIPVHMHIYITTVTSGFVDTIPQKDIKSVQISNSLSTWKLECGGGDSLCLDNSTEIQLFPITSSVIFIDIPLKTGPQKTRYQINFTEYDCSRNDVCWPELAFPLTRFYIGEPYSQALAKGLILVFFFIVASVLGTPWRQVRQIWNTI